MISHIDIKDFAIIKDLSLDLYPGFNVITGETGSGKSVIIEAVSMALGARADTDYIRTGADKALITLVVDTDDDQYVIKREISEGKSICRVNGEIVSLSELTKLCKTLADIHGQYDQQSLLDSDHHINLLDLYGGERLLSSKENVSKAFSKYAESSMKLLGLRKSINESAKQKDYLAFAVDEIEKANLKDNEDAELEENINLMQNAEKIYASLEAAYSLLYADNAALGLLSDASDKLNSLKSYSSEYEELAKRIGDAYYEIDDANQALRKLKEKISFSENELDSAIERQNEINRLKKKYGDTISDIKQYCTDAKEKLNSISNSDEQLLALEKQIALEKAEYDKYAAELSGIRKSVAVLLSEKINKELSELNFNNAEFVASFSSVTPKENGVDAVEFLISTNKGEPPKPLAKIASGGELSRIMLAFKRIIADVDNIPSLIFDEIDTGISGASAGIVGEKMKSISDKHQVICITHLPQIACMADKHFKISKTFDEISTQATVVPLDNEQRIEELARLLSGTTITDTARAQAKALLNQ